MKICFLMQTPFNLGGEQRVVSVIASLLSKNHDVTILCTNNKVKIDYDLYKLDNKVKILFVPRKNDIFSKGMRKIRYELNNFNLKTGIFRKSLKMQKIITYNKQQLKNIIEIINKEKFDVVIGVSRVYTLLVAQISDKIKAKVIGWQHSTYEQYFKTPGFDFYYKRNLVEESLKKLDCYIVLTKCDEEKVRQEFEIDVKTMHNPRSFASKEISELNKKQFLAVGRFSYEKGFDMLLDSFKIFSEKNKDWNLVIVGEGLERDNLQKQIKNYSLENRVKLEHFTNNVKKYYLDSSALLLSSRLEGWGLVNVEAFEMGVPVIAYNLPAIQEIFNNEQVGIIVESFNIEKYADAMLKIAENDEYRKQLGKNAKERAKNFSEDVIQKQWEELLENL